ncbi:ECF transporter S component [Paramicrobacterium agarici]|uniref:ECF transporter S component n=1 Tax=Paramicrobacterium agarici TaxID=630514 RepID=UPI00114FD813|nr:ECF transporter S component [Microbacterium agarici]TQO23363.1 hypothetical protein FB385_2213 [Microbacterium agarici]
MTDARSNWQDVIRQVPEFENVTPPSGNDRLSLTHSQSLPEWASPAQLLAALQAPAAGRSEKKVLNVLRSDRERRTSIARKDANRPQKIVVVTIIILLTVTVGVLFLPNSPTDFDDYFVEIGVGSVITGLLGVASLVASYVVERRSMPRSLPYTPPLLIVYGVLFALGTVMFSMHVSNYEYWFLPSAVIGAVCVAVTAVGYFALYFWVRKRQTLVQALHSESPEGQKLDAALNEHIGKILRKHGDLDEEAHRQRTVDGVKRLYDQGRISSDTAVSMLREIARPLST